MSAVLDPSDHEGDALPTVERTRPGRGQILAASVASVAVVLGALAWSASDSAEAAAPDLAPVEVVDGALAPSTTEPGPTTPDPTPGGEEPAATSTANDDPVVTVDEIDPDDFCRVITGVEPIDGEQPAPDAGSGDGSGEIDLSNDMAADHGAATDHPATTLHADVLDPDGTMRSFAVGSAG